MNIGYGPSGAVPTFKFLEKDGLKNLACHRRKNAVKYLIYKHNL